MAREFARILTSIWHDPEWLSLTTREQSVFVAAITTPDLSWCGVSPYLPKRLAAFASDLTERTATQAVASLEARRFVVVDRTTDELLVRSYVRHDGLLRKPNIARAMEKALDRVHSGELRAVVIRELSRAYVDEPKLSCWDAMAPELMASVLHGADLPESNYSPSSSANYSGSYS